MDTTTATIAIDRMLAAKFRNDTLINVIKTLYSNPFFSKDDIQKRKGMIKKYQEQLKKLISLPKIEQRTPEWYSARQTLITASDFAQALGDGKFGSSKQVIQKKCGFEKEGPINNSVPALKWGTMFEDVACNIYSQRNNVKIHEFGLIRHPDISHFGASPDGVSEFGIMVEIKCPYVRKIDGQVPLQYFYQIQGQLDVCGLSECDYFECEFDSVEGFMSEDLTANFVNMQNERGAIIEIANGDSYSYIYSKVNIDWTNDTITEWIKKESASLDNPKIHIYSLRKCNTIRVFKDQSFLNEKLELLKDVWEKIKTYREDEELYNKEIKTIKKDKFKLVGCAFK